MIVKKIIAVLSCVIMTFSLTSCNRDSKEQKELNAQHIETAKENAKNYIMQKYGFEAEITDATLERRYDYIGSSPLTTVFVRMNYNGRDFGVYIDGSSSNTDGYGNYQAEDLQAAVWEECETLIPGAYSIFISSSEVYTVYDPIEAECKNMHHAYFDGTNAADILLSAPSCSITICYVNTDFSVLQDTYLFDKFRVGDDDTVSFISYRSEDALKNDLPKENSLPDTGTESAVYIDCCYTLTNSGGTMQSYEIGKHDYFYYYVEGGNPSDVSFRKITPDYSYNWNGHGSSHAEITSDAFSVSSNKDCTVYIYFPTDKIKSYKDYDTDFAICRESEKEKTFSSSPIKTTARPYHVENLEIRSDEDFYFVFLDDRYYNN